MNSPDGGALPSALTGDLMQKISVAVIPACYDNSAQSMFNAGAALAIVSSDIAVKAISRRKGCNFHLQGRAAVHNINNGNHGMLHVCQARGSDY